jgi:hypothetical protein
MRLFDEPAWSDAAVRRSNKQAARRDGISGSPVEDEAMGTR